MTAHQKNELLKISRELDEMEMEFVHIGVVKHRIFEASIRIAQIVNTRTEFNGFVNEETNSAYEHLAPREYEMEKGYTVETLADKLADIMTEEVESSSFSDGLARELAEQFLQMVDFEEIADRLIEDKAEGEA